MKSNSSHSARKGKLLSKLKEKEKRGHKSKAP